MVDRSVGGAWRSLMAGNCPSMARNVDFSEAPGMSVEWRLRGFGYRWNGLARDACDALPTSNERLLWTENALIKFC